MTIPGEYESIAIDLLKLLRRALPEDHHGMSLGKYRARNAVVVDLGSTRIMCSAPQHPAVRYSDPGSSTVRHLNGRFVCSEPDSSLPQGPL